MSKLKKKMVKIFNFLSKIGATCKFDISILSCHEEKKVFLEHCFEKLNDKALFPLVWILEKTPGILMIFFCTVHQLENNDTRGVLLTQLLMVCVTAENIYLIELFFQWSFFEVNSFLSFYGSINWTCKL